MNDFKTFAFDDAINNAIAELRYLNPTPIQQLTIPLILANHDVMARANTGTGKTAAFSLPLLQKLISDTKAESGIKILILAPTRELCRQIHHSICEFSVNTDIESAMAYGGVSGRTQLSKITDKTSILVATPGRLLEHLNNKAFSLSKVNTLVFDEADRLLDLGFKDEIDRILVYIPKKRQNLLFSATFDKTIYSISKRLLNNPKLVEIENDSVEQKDQTLIEQHFYTVDQNRKRELTSYLIGSNNWQRVLVFVRTKKEADHLATEMKKDGIPSASFHGDKTQGYRDKTLKQFKNNEVRALIATDVAARGIDINNLEQVINYELPYQSEDYIHRIGRTGRAGKKGEAISLVSYKETWLLESIEKLLKKQIIQQWYPGFEPSLNQEQDEKSYHNDPRKKISKKREREKALGINKRRVNKFARRK